MKYITCTISLFFTLLSFSTTVRAQDSPDTTTYQSIDVRTFIRVLDDYIRHRVYCYNYDYFSDFTKYPDNIYAVRAYSDTAGIQITIMFLKRYEEIKDYNYQLLYYNSHFFFLINDEEIFIDIPEYMMLSKVPSYIFGEADYERVGFVFDPQIFQYKIESNIINRRIHYPASRLEPEYWPYTIKDTTNYTFYVHQRSSLRINKRYSSKKAVKVFSAIKKLSKHTCHKLNIWMTVDESDIYIDLL